MYTVIIVYVVTIQCSIALSDQEMVKVNHSALINTFVRIVPCLSSYFVVPFADLSSFDVQGS